MQSIEIQKGVQVGFDDFVRGAMQMDTPDLEKLTNALNHILARRKAVVPETELVLIDKIYELLKFEQQERYQKLQTELSNETITEEEYRELMNLTRAAEAQNIVWLEAVVELAKLRNVFPQMVIKQLGLEKRFENG